MKFKKFAKVLLSCMMAGALFTGCGGGDKPADKPAADAETSTVKKLGMITHLNVTEKRMDELYQEAVKKAAIEINRYEFVYFDNLNLMQMGIEAGKVDEISLYDSVADYLIANNDKYEITEGNSMKAFADSFCFAVRKDDAALKADLNKAIEEMKADGTLEKLTNDYIVKVDKGQVPPKVEIPMTDGAQTIKVGVTGDFPPLDYVNADGTPAGFNTAILAEIAKRSGKNIELIQIDSGARGAALSSNQIDVIFWAILPNAETFPSDIDKPEGVELSEPYFKDNVTHLKFKK